jgi:hypothetical protein
LNMRHISEVIRGMQSKGMFPTQLHDVTGCNCPLCNNMRVKTKAIAGDNPAVMLTTKGPAIRCRKLEDSQNKMGYDAGPGCRLEDLPGRQQESREGIDICLNCQLPECVEYGSGRIIKT